ncbi:formylglycine-generating enzyme family protein [Halocynthiibacter styelae]|uniref:Formylglycine-generating enzyme family protein n=1 Tax=Halocynthiibacter styelae TaxID=2761955 RepID=A0A8J7IET4_9RHOB|nr:formylglycine-generating enzyme family protein [Paenihalocynthiibacter styelae]MBI1494052.1 formylglycine-generating enzyme family protein [Paenihalocynthiibacter styelae]
MSRTLTSLFLSFTLSASPSILNAEDNGQVISPPRLEPLAHFQECADCPEMITIPPGSFMMGATEEEARDQLTIYNSYDATKDSSDGRFRFVPIEEPRHPVEMDIPYAMARTETTQADWMTCVEAGACSHVPDNWILKFAGYAPLGPDHPVVNVSYLDTLEYVAWLNSLVGADVYRLPTEAEWEYAARAGTTTRFPWGDEVTADQANFSREMTESIQGRISGNEVSRPDLVNRGIPVPVDELNAANPWGLRHMPGNVHEITMSCWTRTHLGLPTDSAYLEHARTQDTCEIMVGKGGGFNSAMSALRPANRFRPRWDTRDYVRGFRVIRELQNLPGS